MSKKHKKVWTTLVYVEGFFLSASAVTERVSISAFVFIFGIPIVNTNSTMTGGTEKYKSTMKKKEAWLAKTKLNTIEVLLSRALIDSRISHDEFVLVNNVLKNINNMNTSAGQQIFWSIYKKTLL